MPTENQSATHCRSDGLHRLGEKKDCSRCQPVAPAKPKEKKQ